MSAEEVSGRWYTADERQAIRQARTQSAKHLQKSDPSSVQVVRANYANALQLQLAKTFHAFLDDLLMDKAAIAHHAQPFVEWAGADKHGTSRGLEEVLRPRCTSQASSKARSVVLTSKAGPQVLDEYRHMSLPSVWLARLVGHADEQVACNIWAAERHP